MDDEAVTVELLFLSFIVRRVVQRRISNKTEERMMAKYQAESKGSSLARGNVSSL